jgi:hypothetical protein
MSMDFLPFDTVGLNVDAIDRFYNTYTALKQKFRLEVTGDIDFNLAQFETFKRYISVRVRGCFTIKQAKNDCYVLFVEVQYRLDNSRYTNYPTEYETWAVAYLKKDFDKIIELVHPLELDFAEDKAFSDTFYVLVNDHAKAVDSIDRDFRNAVMDIRHDDFVIEILEHNLIIGDYKPIEPERAIHLAEFVARVCSVC